MSDALDELRAGGEKVDEGRFRIDSKRALERLRNSRLARPEDWVLDVLRAAQASGAKSVIVRTDVDDVELEFGGKPFPPAAMKNLLTQALGSDDADAEPRVRLFALGIAGALGVGLKWLKVVSGGVSLDLDGDGNVTVGKATAAGTTVAAHKSLRLGLAKSWLTGSPEANTIATRCGYYEPKLAVNGKAPYRFNRKLPTVTKGDLTLAFEVGTRVSHVSLVVYGVSLGSRYPQLPGLPLDATLTCDKMRPDASGTDVVQNDPFLAQGLALLEEQSLLMLKQAVQNPTDSLREQLSHRLKTEHGMNAEARQIIEATPLIPDPAGGFVSLETLKAEVEKGKPVRFARRAYPKDTFPPNTILLDSETRPLWESLLPGKRREDVATQVARKLVSVENRARWAAQPQETVELPDRKYLARQTLDTPKLGGEVGLEAGSSGAFIRLLGQGKFLQQGEVTSLAPLRLRAVVDFRGELPARTWEEVPNDALMKRVATQVEAAAKSAILSLLSTKELPAAVRLHAKDLLARLGRGGVAFQGLPTELVEAPLFECLGGTYLSMTQLENELPWRFVSTRFPHPLLSGKPVLLLDAQDHGLLAPYANGRWKNVADDLDREQRTRDRLQGPRMRPVVPAKIVSVPIRGDGISGEVALTADDYLLQVELFRDGFWLESTRVAARYGVGRAAVDAVGFKPNDDWTAAVRDASYDAAIDLVHEGERALAAEVVRFSRFSKMPGSLRRYLLAFAQKELKDADSVADPLLQLVVQAPFIDTPSEPTSIDALRRRANETGHVWLLPPNVSAWALPVREAVIAGGPEVRELVEAAIGCTVDDGMPELIRADARRRFEAQPQDAVEIPLDAPLRVELTYGVLCCVACLDDGPTQAAAVTVTLQRRVWYREQRVTGIPLRVTVALAPDADPATPVTEPFKDDLAAIVAKLRVAVVTAALDKPQLAISRRAIFFALKAQLEYGSNDEVGARLLNATVFPCTDGVSRSAVVFDAAKKVLFCTVPLEGELRAGQPVILALDADIAIGLARFRQREDVTQVFQNELTAREARKRVAPIEEIRFSGVALISRRVKGTNTEGELAIAPELGGQLELLVDRRPLCTVSDALPWPFAAKVNCDALTTDATHAGVEHDQAYDTLLRQLQTIGGGLISDFAKAWPEIIKMQPTARQAALRLCAWLYSGKKREAANNPLLELPLCKTTERVPLTVAQLLAEKTEHGAVLYATVPGALLGEDARWVWLASAEERAWLEPLKLNPTDAADQLERAELIRSRPKAERMDAPIDSDWREAIDAPDTQGELALPQQPSGRMVLDIFRDNTLLERYDGEHPLGCVGRVNYNALTPNAAWTKANRNAAFKTLMARVERTLEQLVARRLQGEPHDGNWRKWCRVAALAYAKQQGALAKILPTLPLFKRLDHQSVTVGEALTEFARVRCIAIASEGLDAGDKLVLQRSAETIEVLEAFGLTTKDVSDELRRKGEQEADRQARRLQELSWEGDALVRLPIPAGDGMTGELAVPASGVGSLWVAKQGVRVCTLHADIAVGAFGVIDIESLEVDETWRKATLTKSQRDAIAHHVDTLNELLARTVPQLDRAQRLVARDHVLMRLEHAGVKAPLHLERLNGAVLSLAAARVFETLEGDWVSALGIAEEVRRRGKVAVFAKSLFKPDTSGALGLITNALDAPWLDMLEKVLGGSSVERVKDRSAWRERLREEDPPKGSPELWALDRLRRDVRLLRAGALGQLSPEDLEDIRLKPLGGRGAPVQYDKKRKVALLDSDHGQVKRALAEAATRRERIYVLLAAMYGAINRALERITDEHEAHLLGALAAHLAANPRLLSAESPRDDG